MSNSCPYCGADLYTTSGGEICAANCGYERDETGEYQPSDDILKDLRERREREQ